MNPVDFSSVDLTFALHTQRNCDVITLSLVKPVKHGLLKITIHYSSIDKCNFESKSALMLVNRLCGMCVCGCVKMCYQESTF